MKASARVLTFALSVLIALLLTSCSGGTSSDSGASSDTGSDSPFVLEDSASVEEAIVAAEGGSIEVTSTAGEIVRISFPRGSLAEDVTLVAAPLAEDPLGDENVIIPGFSLEVKGTGAGPELVYPAFVTVVVDGELDDTTSLVRYNDDASGYEVVPTTVASRDGMTQLVAQVDHFSAFGGMDVTQEEKDEAAQQQASDFDWVVYINDTTEVPGGYITQTIELNLTARCTGGNIMGDYTGSATAVTTNEGDYGGGYVSATANSQSTHLAFTIGPTLAPLVEPDEDADLPLAPLTEGGPDFTGYGTISMSTAGDGTYTKNGLAAGGTFGNDSSLPLEIYINGPQARLALISPQGMVYWDGYIIGEGR